ncbi:MAG: PilZ domain-containing protein [Candidatus Omnitrophica bacterium]|nr:PilZ domain-containing protein [Candidatus Omnitrophota bacterium]
MFIKDEYQQSLHLAVHRQIKSIFELHQLMMNISDESLFEQLKEICQGQAKVYSTYKTMLDALKLTQSENRLANRENALGWVHVQENLTGSTGDAKCLDISPLGMRMQLESTEDINAGRKFNVWIDLLDRGQTLRRVGVVKWARKIAEAEYQCGIQFC